MQAYTGVVRSRHSVPHSGQGSVVGLHAQADELVDLVAELLPLVRGEWCGCLHGCRRPHRRSPVKAADAPTPSGVDGASTRGSPRQTGRRPPSSSERSRSTAVLLDRGLMETRQRRARGTGTRQVAARRTRSVPGRGRPHGRYADTKAEYFYIYAGDDPANATDPSGKSWTLPGGLCTLAISECFPRKKQNQFTHGCLNALNPVDGFRGLLVDIAHGTYKGGRILKKGAKVALKDAVGDEFKDFLPTAPFICLGAGLSKVFLGAG